MIWNGQDSTLTAIRTQLKSELETETFLGQQLLDVWINELAPAEEGSTDSWDACLQQVDEADIVLVLQNGNAGWTSAEGGIGICHAELERALSKAPGKVRLIELSPFQPAEPLPKDSKFREYIRSRNLFHSSADTGEDLIEVAKTAVTAAIVHQVKLGVREANRGKYHLGAALDWSRLDYQKRQMAMVQAVKSLLIQSEENELPELILNGSRIVVSQHSIPDSYSVSEARELVGKPFVEDYKLLDKSPLNGQNRLGPLNLIAVHKGMTESNARGFLGHPNVILVAAPFGFYVADRIDHAQVLFLTECRDQTSTAHAVQRCLDWLNQSGESNNVIERARKRKRIIREVARQQD